MMAGRRRKTEGQEVIGLIPAGGSATRISPLPCSKEVFPVGFRKVDKDGSVRPKVACHYLLESMHLAGVRKAYIVLRQGKWDIPGYLGDGGLVSVDLAYLMMDLPFGVPFTIDQAFPFVRDALVAFGFPDVLFRPRDAFLRLIARQRATNADVILGVFCTDSPQKADMVKLDGKGRVVRIDIKPRKTHLRYAWIMAVWTPVFTEFLHEYVSVIHNRKVRKGVRSIRPPERQLFIGDVVQAGISKGVRVDAVAFTKGSFLDLGTPEDLMKAIRTCDQFT